MGRNNKYVHEHEESSDWFAEEFLNHDTSRVPSASRNVHHHKIVAQDTGEKGEGWGWSYHQALKNAWDDLRG